MTRSPFAALRGPGTDRAVPYSRPAVPALCYNPAAMKILDTAEAAVFRRCDIKLSRYRWNLFAKPSRFSKSKIPRVIARHLDHFRTF